MKKRAIKRKRTKRIIRKNPNNKLKSLAYKLGFRQGNWDIYETPPSQVEPIYPGLGGWGTSLEDSYLFSISNYINKDGFAYGLDNINDWKLGYIDAALILLPKMSELSENQRKFYETKITELKQKLEISKYESGLLPRFVNVLFALKNKGSLSFSQIDSVLKLGEKFTYFIINILLHLGYISKALLSRKYSLTKTGKLLADDIYGFNNFDKSSDSFFEIKRILRGPSDIKLKSAA